MQKQTLLLIITGLALIGVVSLVLLSSDPVEDTTNAPDTDTSQLPDDDTQEEDRSVYARVEPTEFGIRGAEYPKDTWAVLSTTTVGLEPKLNVYAVRSSAERDTNLPYTHFSNESHVSVYPEGIPTEGLFADRADFDLETTFPVREDTAVVYTLADGTPFAAYVQPTVAMLPENWEEWGFIFIRARIDGMRTYCTRNGVEISESECDPLASDDEVHYEGSVRLTEWAEATDILRSLRLATEQSDESDSVRVEAPEAGTTVSSPLTVRGAARGSWYFEATLPVELVAEDGTMLAESFAEADGEWMTTDYVPFETNLTFEVPEGVSEGVVRIRKANPSGLPENDNSFDVLVRF